MTKVTTHYFSIDTATATNFLEYYKLILDKVSFDDHLLRKEYHKAQKHLRSEEIVALNEYLGTKLMNVIAANEIKVDNDNCRAVASAKDAEA